MRIDVDKVLRQRLASRYKWIPGPVVRWLERVVCQDELNRLLEHNGHLEGAKFARGVVEDLGVTYEIKGVIPPASEPRVVFVSNHPLGGLDGLVLAALTKELFPSHTPRFVVNDLLDYVEPMRGIFLGVNKHGSQSRESARGIEEAFAGDDPMVMFPAGLVSRKGADGSVRDLEWHKMAVVKAISSHRNIIPVHFDGRNSEFFYKFAKLRTKLGLRFNIEMIRLPKEVLLSKGSHFTVTFGNPIPWESLRGGHEAEKQARDLKNIVYQLPEKQ